MQRRQDRNGSQLTEGGSIERCQRQLGQLDRLDSWMDLAELSTRWGVVKKTYQREMRGMAVLLSSRATEHAINVERRTRDEIFGVDIPVRSVPVLLCHRCKFLCLFLNGMEGRDAMQETGRYGRYFLGDRSSSLPRFSNMQALSRDSR
jgi:hypothetical protein